MAEQAKKEASVTLYNRGRGTFKTASGVIRPGEALEVSGDEAKNLIGYPELVDASKIVKGGKSTSALEATISELTSKNEALTKENAKLVKDLEKASKKG